MICVGGISRYNHGQEKSSQRKRSTTQGLIENKFSLRNHKENYLRGRSFLILFFFDSKFYIDFTKIALRLNI